MRLFDIFFFEDPNGFNVKFIYFAVTSNYERVLEKILKKTFLQKITEYERNSFESIKNGLREPTI